LKILFHIAIAALLLSFVVTIQVPIEIYLNNVEEFIIPLKELAYGLSTAFGIGYLVLLLPIVIPYSTFRQCYFVFLAMLAFLLWFTAHFMFGHYGAFDGHGLSINKFSMRAQIEILLWAIALLSVIIFRKKFQQILFHGVSGLLVMVLALTGYQIIHHTIYNNKNVNANQNKHNMTKAFLTFSKRRNIIHFVLDEQQSTIVEILMASNPRFNQHLSGFTYFPNTTANFRSTVMAIPAMFTGQVYKNVGDRNIFLKQVLNHNPFTTILENAHFNTAIYTLGFYCNIATIKNCMPHPSLSSRLSSILLLDYSLFKVMPEMLKPMIYNKD